MEQERIERIAELAGVSYALAYDWIVDPDGDWQNTMDPVSKEEHDTWTESASDEAIASWIRAGQ